MNPLVDSITQMLGSSAAEQIGGILGADKNLVSDAINGITPSLISGMSGTMSQEGGADNMVKMLGGLDTGFLDNIGDFLGGGNFDIGHMVLKAIFGDQVTRIIEGVAKMVGMDSTIMGKLLPMIAPIVIGMIKRMFVSSNLDGAGLGNMLNEAKGYYQESAPDAMAGIDKMLQGDEGILDQIADVGKGLLGGLLGKN